MKDMAKQEHYEVLSPQPIEVIKAWNLDFFLGNVVKYIGRCKTKGQELEDLEKAKVYLQWKIDELKGAETEKPKDPRKPGWHKRPYEEAYRIRAALGYTPLTQENFATLPTFFVDPRLAGDGEYHWVVRDSEARGCYYEEVK